MLKKKKLILNLVLLIAWIFCLWHCETIRISIFLYWGILGTTCFGYFFIRIPWIQRTVSSDKLPIELPIISDNRPISELTFSYIYLRAIILRPFNLVTTVWAWLHFYVKGHRLTKDEKLSRLVIYSFSIITLIAFHLALIYLINILILIKYIIWGNEDAEILYLTALNNLYPGSAKTISGYPIKVALIGPNSSILFL